MGATDNETAQVTVTSDAILAVSLGNNWGEVTLYNGSSTIVEWAYDDFTYGNGVPIPAGSGLSWPYGNVGEGLNIYLARETDFGTVQITKTVKPRR